MKDKLIIYALAALTLINGTQAQSRAGNAIPVTPDDFIRAETGHYFSTPSRMEVSGNSTTFAN